MAPRPCSSWLRGARRRRRNIGRARPAAPGAPAVTAPVARTATEDPLVIRALEFVGGMASPDGWRPDTGLPEVAFAGRSNVGKSALLNALVRRRKLARVSTTPGRTREINFFRVNDRFVIADLPGYGYARVSRSQREAWKPLIEGYFEGSAQLRGVVLLIDVRREPTADDRAMLEYLADLGAPSLVALTKVDKLTAARLAERQTALARALDVGEDQVVATSAHTGRGRDELAAAIAALVDAPTWR